MTSLLCPVYLTVNLFSVLEICYLVLLNIIEAFNPPGSTGTDIKSAGGCRETEKNRWSVVRRQGIFTSRQERHPENTGWVTFPHVWSYMSVLNAGLIVDTEISLASIFCVTMSFHCEVALLGQGRGTPSLAGVLGSWEWGLGCVVCIPKF